MPVGVMVRDLAASELSYRLLHHARRKPLVFFQEHPALPVIEPAAPVVSTAEAWGYRGPLVATTVGTAAKLARFPAGAPKAFYLWDLDWHRLAAPAFRELAAVYRDPALALVCRHDDHRKLVEDVWGRPVAGVVPDADPYRIAEAACPAS